MTRGGGCVCVGDEKSSRFHFARIFSKFSKEGWLGKMIRQSLLGWGPESRASFFVYRLFYGNENVAEAAHKKQLQMRSK